MAADRYYLEAESLQADSEDNFSYREVSLDESVCSSGDEDLNTALHHITTDIATQSLQVSTLPQSTEVREEVVEDFVRNFLVSIGLNKTLDIFQAEWYELQLSGHLQDHHSHTLPDIYKQNQKIEEKVTELKKEIQTYKDAARESKEQYICLKKERDYHRMQHRRVLQEKAGLSNEVGRLRKHFSSYEPLLQSLRKKYQSVTKEKTLACLERDRALSEVECLQSTLHSVQQKPSANYVCLVPSAPQQPDTNTAPQQPDTNMKLIKYGPVVLPAEPANPYLHSTPPVSTHLTRTGGLQPTHTLPAHQYATTNVSIHPSKDVIVTTSDDHTWKMWALPSCELMMTGEGHTDWLSYATFHPTGDLLATASGDGTVKIWDFNQTRCTLTFAEHRQPVWQCSWHWSGQYLASGGMDHSTKIWDITSEVCIATLRGHGDSINAVHFLPYTNSLITASADKTISHWDIRTGLCVQTYYGHQNSCNDITSDLKGQYIYSCDSLGGLLCWDIRSSMEPVQSWNMSPSTLHNLSLDPAGVILACARSDGIITLLDTSYQHQQQQEWRLSGHEECVLSVVFTPSADSLLSSAADGTVIIWR